MTSTGHAIIGAAIASKIPNPMIAVPLILISHFLGDALPHWDTGFDWRNRGLRKVFFDTLVDLGVSYLAVYVIFIWLFKFDPLTVLLGAFLAQLPDFLEFPYFFLHWRFPPFSWINTFQHLFHRKLALPWGFINQAVVASFFVIWAFI